MLSVGGIMTMSPSNHALRYKYNGIVISLTTNSFHVFQEGEYSLTPVTKRTMTMLWSVVMITYFFPMIIFANQPWELFRAVISLTTSSLFLYWLRYTRRRARINNFNNEQPIARQITISNKYNKLTLLLQVLFWWFASRRACILIHNGVI